MKKAILMLICCGLGAELYASEASLDSRLEAARLMYETALLQNKGKCVEKAKHEKEKKSISLDTYRLAFRYAYGTTHTKDGQEECIALPDIKTRGFSDKFKDSFNDFKRIDELKNGFPFPENLTRRIRISKKGEFLDNIFATKTESRIGIGLDTKILPQDQIDKVITFLKKYILEKGPQER